MDTVNAQNGTRRGPLFYVGSAGLLGMMVVEAASVIGRHIGVPVMGAIELVQAAIVPAACAAMLIATQRGAHAAVHMLTERLPEAARGKIARAGSVLSALFFAAMCAGGTWLSMEYWDTFEKSEVLSIPFRPLRALVALTGAALAVTFLRMAFQSKRVRSEKTP
jgi:TRAP-type C4-dicarboxylate transport system permease small subunit